MKTKLLTLFVLLLLFTGSKAQYITIPDPNFASWLHNNGFDSCMAGNLFDTTCHYIYPSNTLDLSGQNISDLTGYNYIQYYNPINASPYKTLNLSHNNFTSFPSVLLRDNLRNLTIDLSYNHIDSFTFSQDYFFLYSLSLANNHLQKVKRDTASFNLTSLWELNLNNNDLDSFPHIYANNSTGYNLYIRNNKLKSFPASGNAQFVDIGVNRLDSNTIVGGPNLRGLVCDSNELTELLLAGWFYQWSIINCSHNKIRNLLLPYPSVRNIDCSFNQLTSIDGPIADVMGTLNVSNNPDLKCLPQLRRIDTLDFSNTSVTCLPGYGTVLNSTPQLSSVPICGYLNTNGCSIYYNNSGKIYFEAGNNCVQDNGDSLARNVKIKLMKNGIVVDQVITPNGLYSLSTPDTGIYQLVIDTSSLAFRAICPANAEYTIGITTTDSLNTDKDFSLTCTSQIDLVAQSISGRFLPGATSPVLIGVGDLAQYFGKNCLSGVSGMVQLKIDSPVRYVSPYLNALTPAFVSNDTITWQINDFGSVSFISSFNINVITDSAAQAGQPVCLTLIITPTTADEHPENNVVQFCTNIRNAYDPNIKEVSPAGNIDTSQKWLTYTVQFQNTGTAEARNIHVDDTLDTDLDVETFQLLAYSHQPQVELKGNAVRFNFANINLPDSNTNEAASHGYVQYKVRLKNNLPIGTQINNTAFIYFDFNSAVVTNTTTNTITLDGSTGITISEQGNFRFQLYPNPASSAVNIALRESLKAATVTVTNVTGQKLISAPLQASNTTLTTDFANGIYFVTVTNNGQSYTRKLVVNH